MVCCAASTAGVIRRSVRCPSAVICNSRARRSRLLERAGAVLSDFRRPADISSLIDDGITGFIVESDAVRAVRQLPRLDRNTIRARFEERFSARRMAREYEAQYRKLIAGRGSARESAPGMTLNEPAGVR